MFEGGQIGIDDYRVVATTLAGPRAVAWGAETTLVIGGERIGDTKVSMVSIAIDGTGQDAVPTEGSEGYTIAELSVRPASPLGLGPRYVMFEANNVAYDAYAEVIQLVRLAPATGEPVSITAPFFLD